MKQIIQESKIQLLNSNPNLNETNTIKSYSPLITQTSVISNYTNLSHGVADLNLSNQSYLNLGHVHTQYAYVELVSSSLFYISFSIEDQQISFKTSNFSYKNNKQRLSNLKIANGTLFKLTDLSFTQLENSKQITVNYVLLENYDITYLNIGEFPYAHF